MLFIEPFVVPEAPYLCDITETQAIEKAETTVYPILKQDWDDCANVFSHTKQVVRKHFPKKKRHESWKKHRRFQHKAA